MSFHLPSLQGQSVSQVTQDYAQRAMLYVATGALLSRVSMLSVKEGLVFGLINSACVQFGHSIVKTDESASQRLLVSMGSMAISTLLMASLIGRVGLHLSVTSGIALALLNGFGELAKVLILPTMYTFFFAPAIPQKADEVKELSEAGVHYLHQTYGGLKEKIGAEALPHLHACFYKLGLPLPEGKEFLKMRHATETFSITELALPQTVKEAAALTKNQCCWLAFSLLEHKGLSKLDFEVQVALRLVMTTEISFQFCVHPKSVQVVEKITDQSIIKMLHDQYTSSPDLWQGRAPEIKDALNIRFKKSALIELSTAFQVPTQIKTLASMSKEQFQPVYDYFDNHRDEYAEMHLAYKIEFNKKVSNFFLAPLN